VFIPGNINALDNINLVVEEGEFLALTGPSGSGKTTLLNILAGVDRPTAGSLWVNGVPVDKLAQRPRTAWRHQHIGFIFRTFNLAPALTVRENVGLPLLLAKLSRRQKNARIDTVLGLAGLGRPKDAYPRQLSSEQRQRVAIARAIVMDPPLILADEPTGELSARATEDILILLSQLHSEWGKTVILATHDQEAAKYAQRTWPIDKGVRREAEALSGRSHGLPDIR
jgi:putative ABC transport system ATP-binding protein